MNRFWLKPLAIAAFALSLATPLGALAASSTSVTVTGGTLSVTNPTAANFPGVTITGAAQSPTAALGAFTVSDLTGTGAGWHVTAQATQFANAAATRKLATGSLSLSKPTVTANGTTSAGPTVNAAPYVIDNATAVTIASAAVGAGMGNYDFSATTLTLAIPADVYADTYTSSVTISVVSAP